MQVSKNVITVLNLSANEAIDGRFEEIEPEHLFLALLKFCEVDPQKLKELMDGDLSLQDVERDQKDLRNTLKKRGLNPTLLRRRLRTAMGQGGARGKPEQIKFSAKARQFVPKAEKLAGQDKSNRPVMCNDYLRAMLTEPTAILAQFLKGEPKAPVHKTYLETEPNQASGEGIQQDQAQAPIGELVGTLRTLRDGLRAKIYGQDHAIQAFVEGLFSAEVVAGADEKRRQPKGIFVFAGPPGVGKTYLAESGAEALGRPFKRFDMSAYSDHQAGMGLVGVHRSYQGAHPGLLTEFVNENPNAVLLFDEIEKTHLNTIQMFLQILDAGRLEDKNTEEYVAFRDTVIIFTTNAGKSLYDRPDSTGVNAANSSYHRKTILDALEKEVNPSTGQPVFPAALCSRLATGHPVMLNHLGVNELEKIAQAELRRQSDLLSGQYNKEVEFDPAVPICLVLSEGAKTDARTVKSRAESFVKTEMYKFCQLYRPENLQQVLDTATKIKFCVDDLTVAPADVRDLLAPKEKPKVLLVTSAPFAGLWAEQMPSISWWHAPDKAAAMSILSLEDIDLVLLDLWVKSKSSSAKVMSASAATEFMSASAETAYLFDYVPPAANQLKEGQDILMALRERYPEVPCYLLSLAGDERDVDEELFLACVRSGGARGLVETPFVSIDVEGWEEARDALASTLNATSRWVWRENKARQLGSEHKALSFDTAPRVSSDEDTIAIRLRNFRLARALAAEDVSEMLDEVDRPTISFTDVYGADAAKGALEHIVEWLKDPKKYKAMGLRPPRGILLYGHPGTGKTMLARALAGESNVAFLVASAANFITMWQGSGPQSIRDLFDRARRYAPSILFIDEIDAIGKKRSGGVGGGQASSEQTLNALLTEMDGFSSPASRPVIVIAATNLVELLDDALRRRFDQEIEVDRPDKAGRQAYLERRLQGVTGREVSDTVIDRMAGQSAGMTIAELERIIELAGRTAAKSDGVITDEVIEEAFETMRMGEARGRPDEETLRRVARHESGHCLIGWLRGENPVQVTIMARGKAGGFVERESDEDRMIYTKGELEGMIRQAMAGRAAEMLYYGDDEGLSTGVGEDLRAATRYAEMMVRDYGMDVGIGQVALDLQRFHSGPLAADIMRATGEIVSEQLKKARAELDENRQSLDHLVEQLMQKNRLTRDDLEEILPKRS